VPDVDEMVRIAVALRVPVMALLLPRDAHGTRELRSLKTGTRRSKPVRRLESRKRGRGADEGV
jgi:hypothetical protein